MDNNHAVLEITLRIYPGREMQKSHMLRIVQALEEHLGFVAISYQKPPTNTASAEGVSNEIFDDF